MRLPPLPEKRIALRHFAYAIAAAVVILVIDQASKRYVVDGLNLREVGQINGVLPILNFRMAWNTGVNFGLLSADSEMGRIILIAFTSMLATVLAISSAWCTRPLSAIGLGVAAGGAVGNLIDRFTWGAVADFLNVSGFGIENPWSFNVADVAIFAGLGLLLWPPAKKAAAGKS